MIRSVQMENVTFESKEPLELPCPCLT